MSRKEIIPIIFGSIVLLLYYWMIISDKESGLTSFLFVLFPFILIWIVFSILIHGKFEGKELGEQEEWGYTDKDKNELGVF